MNFSRGWPAKKTHDTPRILGALLLLSVMVSRSLGFVAPAPTAVIARRQASAMNGATHSFLPPSPAGCCVGTVARGGSLAGEDKGRPPSCFMKVGPSQGVASRRSRFSILATPLPETPDGPPSEPEPRRLVYGETAKRSFVKALSWRITAGVVTLISGLVFSGSLSTAMSIVGSDFLTKSGFMFLGERLWNKVKWGQGKTGDSTKRSLAKAVLWRVFAASNTLICGMFLAKDLGVASKIAGTDTIFKTALFFLNERMWNAIEWGKEFEPEYFI